MGRETDSVNVKLKMANLDLNSGIPNSELNSCVDQSAQDGWRSQDEVTFSGTSALQAPVISDLESSMIEFGKAWLKLHPKYKNTSPDKQFGKCAVCKERKPPVCKTYSSN